jgi:catechol 2,3-dioxygenase-like lactoylglutathione lyase family enzyme
MTQLVKNRIGGIFVPVRDVAKARDWYRGLLGLPRDDEPLGLRRGLGRVGLEVCGSPRLAGQCDG